MEQEKSDFKYFEGRKPNRTYISKSFQSNHPDDIGKNIRFITKVIDCDDGITHKLTSKKEIVLRTTPKERQQIRIKWYEDDKKIATVSLQKYEQKTGIPHKISFCFKGEEVQKLKDFIGSIQILNFSDKGGTRIEEDEIIKMREELIKNAPLLKEILKNNITEIDIVSLGYRKNQLYVFKNLLDNGQFFDAKKKEWKKIRDEDVWQYFFEKNNWIFGYGLNFSFNEPINQNQLEQVIKGFDISSGGKRVDALLKTRGVINSICLVEIKKPGDPLLKEVKNPYRSECWQLSDELNGGISQSQKNSQKTIESIGTKLQLKKEDGTPTGGIIFSYLPKSYLIIGNLKQFVTEKGINEEKYSSFELYRKNIINPEIITFDELFERAKFIVEANERNINN